MNLPISVDQKQLMDVLLNMSTVRPVFIWGPPGIGKSAIVEQFASDVGLECVSLLGSQLAPEDIIGVPQIVEGRSVFCPPRMIAREEALLPVSGRIERLLPGGAEGLLLPDPGAADRGVPAAGGVHRRGGGEPLPGQRHHKAHVLRPAEPDVPCGAAGGQPPLAGVGRRPWDPPLGLRLHLRPAGPAVEPALQDGGALLHAPQLAHAQRRPEQLRRGRLRAGGRHPGQRLSHRRPRHPICRLCAPGTQPVFPQEDLERGAALAGQAGGAGCAVFPGPELPGAAAEGAAPEPRQAQRRRPRPWPCGPRSCWWSWRTSARRWSRWPSRRRMERRCPAGSLWRRRGTSPLWPGGGTAHEPAQKRPC